MAGAASSRNANPGDLAQDRPGLTRSGIRSRTPLAGGVPSGSGAHFVYGMTQAVRMDQQSALPAAPAGPAPRRADAGMVRLGERDAAGLLLCGDMYGASMTCSPPPWMCARTGYGGSWPAGAAPGTAPRPGWGRVRRGAG